MKTATEIVSFVGEEPLAQRVGVSRKTVREAVRSGRLPAAWYHALEDMAGRPLPRELFSFKGMAA